MAEAGLHLSNYWDTGPENSSWQKEKRNGNEWKNEGDGKSEKIKMKIEEEESTRKRRSRATSSAIVTLL